MTSITDIPERGPLRNPPATSAGSQRDVAGRGSGPSPRKSRGGRPYRGLWLAAGLLVGVGGVLLVRPAPKAPPVATGGLAPTEVVYVPSTLADTPSEAERVDFERFCQHFLEVWLQPGPVEARRKALEPLMTPTGLRAQLAKDQARLPRGLPVGPPKIANTSPLGGLYLVRLSGGSSVEVIVQRGAGGGWLVDDIQG